MGQDAPSFKGIHMNLQALSRFLWGVSEMCFDTYERLKEVDRGPSVPDVVDVGGRGLMRWIAVPFSQAGAFRAAFPQTGTMASFFDVLGKWERTNPDGYRYMLPFARQVVVANETYGNECQIFVMSVE